MDHREASGGTPDSRRLLAAIVESSDDAIISKDVNGIVMSWNAGAERVFGYTADEMIGRPVNILAAPGREDEMPEILERIRRGERVDHFETTRRHKDGTVLQVSLTVSPIYDDEGQIIGASKVARDITAARIAEAELREAEARLLQQHRELMHAARLGELGQMAASIAHEITQPLSAISNYLAAGQRLLKNPDPTIRGKVDEALQRAMDQAVRAAEIVRRLRTLARFDIGGARPEPIAELLEEAMSVAALDAGHRGVDVEISPVVEAMVLADRVEVEQVLLNLTRNALEAMEGQQRRHLTVSAIDVESGIEVSVADTGPGLAPEVRDHLFEPFVSTKEGGMGIGLAICRRIVEGHGGQFRATDNPGGGTIFAFTLPKASTLEAGQDAAGRTRQ